MLKVSWNAAHNPVLTGVNIDGYAWSFLWDIPEENVGAYIRTHRLGIDGAPHTGTFTIEDENTIDWGPSVVPDNWCNQLGIYGTYELDLAKDQYPSDIIGYDEYGNAFIVIGGLRCFINDRWETHPRWDFSMIGERLSPLHYQVTRVSHAGYSNTYVDVTLTPEVGYYIRRIETRYDWGDPQVRYDSIPNDDFGFRGISLKPVSPSQYRSRYENLTSYVKRYAEANIWPKLRYDVDEWDSCLQAVDGFHPYDINLVETIVQADMEDVVPRNTSEKNLDLLTKAVNSKGGLASPRGMLAGSQIFANTFLYYKYVASGNYSDFSQLCIGDDKAFIGDIVTQMFENDPSYKPTNENWRLKRIAEAIVHRGTKALTSYGTKDFHQYTALGQLDSITRSRCTAYPSYYDSMSACSIVCEEFGLSLTPKRLAEVIPYEFVAQWFLPIEETIHSIEMNSARLESMYKLKNLCISRKDLISLDDDFLRAMFGLSSAHGHLTLKRYNRRSQLSFPPTALDLSLRPQISLSKVMQGSSLFITRLR